VKKLILLTSFLSLVGTARAQSLKTSASDDYVFSTFEGYAEALTEA
jgi:hypothetical protein